jgi:hypothetical protein
MLDRAKLAALRMPHTWLGDGAVRWVEIAGMRLPVLALEYEYQAYRTIGRIERANLLRRWLDAREEEPE